MDRSDLQQLSKEQLIELVLGLQRPDKNSRTSSKPPSTEKKRSARTLGLAGRSWATSRTTVGWLTIPTRFEITCRRLARIAAARFRALIGVS
jgi:hypothetical protein